MGLAEGRHILQKPTESQAPTVWGLKLTRLGGPSSRSEIQNYKYKGTSKADTYVKREKKAQKLQILRR